jgi:predicted DCC family thiol-disulfide oxidoreductase YuxK
MLTLFYDANCDFCKKLVVKIESKSTDKLVLRTLQSVQSREPAFANFSNEELMSQLWLLDSTKNNLFGGYFAFKHLAIDVLSSKFLKILFNLPWADLCGPMVYKLVARNRRLAGCNSESCGIHD